MKDICRPLLMWVPPAKANFQMTITSELREGPAQFFILPQDEGLHLAAGRWRRQLSFTPHGASTHAIAFEEFALPLAAAATAEPECIYDGLSRLAYLRRQDPWVPLSVASREQDDVHGVRVTWRDEKQGLRLTREWRVLPETETWVTRASVMSEAAPEVEFGRADYFNVVETLPLDLSNWRARAVRFYGDTDHHNELVAVEEFVIEPDSEPRGLRGNLLFLDAPDGAYGVFLLHEAPPENEKRIECECDFLVGPNGVRVLGWGIPPHEVLPDRERFSYSVATGFYEGGATGGDEALRRYLKARFPLRAPERAIVANPWGDRRCYEKLSEAFVLEELEACAELGITHYQIDDGWEAGGVLPDICVHNWARERSFWDINPQKFPRGFAPLAERAQELGVQLALWFAPDCNRHYRNWSEDRDILLDFHRRYGINLIKIDAVWLRTKEAEENLYLLLGEVERESGGKVRFNLDVTAGRRLGYFANMEMGSLFIENRYVTTGWTHNTYQPHKTLRNFWMLARYVPPEKTQFEVPNIANIIARLRDESDPLNPVHYSWDYIAAIVLFSSPLIWCEPSGLPAEARVSWKKMLGLHHAIRDELARGYTFPIGQEPSGRSWTGFQSYEIESPHTGLLLVFREATESASYAFTLNHMTPNARVRLRCLSHDEPEFIATADAAGGLELHIATQRDFRLYRYTVED